jgi:hypothetical protein
MAADARKLAFAGNPFEIVGAERLEPLDERVVAVLRSRRPLNTVLDVDACV